MHVGDDINTDIIGGNRLGMRAALSRRASSHSQTAPTATPRRNPTTISTACSTSSTSSSAAPPPNGAHETFLRRHGGHANSAMARTAPGGRTVGTWCVYGPGIAPMATSTPTPPATPSSPTPSSRSFRHEHHDPPSHPNRRHHDHHGVVGLRCRRRHRRFNRERQAAVEKLSLPPSPGVVVCRRRRGNRNHVARHDGGSYGSTGACRMPGRVSAHRLDNPGPPGPLPPEQGLTLMRLTARTIR